MRKSRFAREFEELGIVSKVVSLHTSLRSFAIKVSPSDIIESIIELDNTLLVPTMSWSVYSAPKPAGEVSIQLNPELNAEQDGSIPDSIPEDGFDIKSNRVGIAMGALPRTLLESYPRTRGNHPLASFSALGELADFLVGDQTPSDPLKPLSKMITRDSVVVMMGTDLTSATLLHLAESEAGLPGLKRWAKLSNGQVISCNVTGCSNGFERLREPLSGIEQSVEVSGSKWRIYPAGEMMDLATNFFVKNPLGGLCEDSNCTRCESKRKYIGATLK